MSIKKMYMDYYKSIIHCHQTVETAQCPPFDELIVNTMDSYFFTKMNKAPVNATVRTSLRNFMLSDSIWSQITTYDPTCMKCPE